MEGQVGVVPTPGTESADRCQIAEGGRVVFVRENSVQLGHVPVKYLLKV